MKKLKKSLVAIIFALVLTLMFSATASAADEVARVTGLKASSIVNNTVVLSWNSVNDITGYRLQRGVLGSDNKTIVWTTVYEGATPSCSVTLELGKSYSFKVLAYKKTSNIFFTTTKYGSYSTPISVSYSLGKVTNLKVASTTATKVKLTWSAVNNADGYLVQKQVNGKWKDVKSVTATSYTVTGLTTNTTTPFRVKAYALVNGKKVYGSVSSTVKGTAAVPAIKDFKVTVKSTSSIELSWGKATLTGYQIYRKVGSGDWKKIKTISKNSTVTFTNTSLKLGTKYQYKIRGYYKTDSKTYYGAFTSVKSATPSLPKVVGIQLTTINLNRATIKWDKVNGATGYQIYDYTSGSGVKIATASSNSTTIVVNDNQITKIKIRAYLKSSGSTITGNFSSAFEIYSKPAKVTNLVVETLPNDAIQLTWDDVEIAHGYNVEVYNNTKRAWEFLAVSTENSYIIKNPTQLPGYNIRVSAFVKNNGISLSGAASNPLLLEIIHKPDLFFADNTKNSITLTWTPISNATSYVLEKYNFDSDSWKTLKETTETRYTDKSDNAMSGMYRVYAKSVTGSRSSASDEIVLYSEGISVSQDGAAQTITWPAVDNAYKYRISIKDSYGDRGYLGSVVTIEKNNTAVLSLTPDTVQSLMIHAYSSDGGYIGCVVDELMIKTEKFKILDSNHPHYNHSINSQILHLVEAINKTKHETGTVTVASGSSVSYNTDKFYINDKGSNTLQALLAIYNGYTGFGKDTNDVKDLLFSGTETSKETLTFENCIAKNTEGKSVNLAKYIEPSDEEFAYLYGSTDPLAWKEGVKSLSVTPVAGGGYKYVMVLYKEEYGLETNVSDARYHKGFATTIASMGQLNSINFNNELSSVGETTITALVNADGTLDAYQVVSPYSMKMTTPISGFYGINSFGMLISGSLASIYTFTR